MNQSWYSRFTTRIQNAWHVLTGRAVACYSLPDVTEEVLLRAAAIEFIDEFDALNDVLNLDQDTWPVLFSTRKRMADLSGWGKSDEWWP